MHYILVLCLIAYGDQNGVAEPTQKTTKPQVENLLGSVVYHIAGACSRHVIRTALK